MSWIAGPILDSVTSFLLWVINLFPSADSIPAPDFSSYMSHLNIFINMPLLLNLVTLFLAYEGVVLSVRALLYLWNLIKP